MSITTYLANYSVTKTRCPRNLARHKIKITLLSATANTLLMDFVGHYLGLGNYKVIGELDQYPIPDVVISVEVTVTLKCYLFLFKGLSS